MSHKRSTGRLRDALKRMLGEKAAVLPDADNAEGRSGRITRRLAFQIAALLAITVGSFMLALNQEWVQRFSHWGYASSFLISLISNATVVLPAPGLVVVFALGANLNPILLGVAAGCGSALGELTGYLAGATGGDLIGRRGVNARLKYLTERYTTPVLFVLALVPTPVFDVAGILSGAMGLPVYRFLAPVAGGKIIKHILIAYAGAGSFPLLRSLLGL